LEEFSFGLGGDTMSKDINAVPGNLDVFPRTGEILESI
jgi:hypothetical protein